VPRVSLGEVTVGYDDEGTGRALLLVHGHPFDRTMWRPQVERFARGGWRVIAPDLRGYGETTVVPGKTTLDVFARDLVALLDHLEITDAVVAGLSMGGQIVMELYRLFPQRVAGLVLADTSAPAETEAGRKARADAADRLLREGMAPYSKEVLTKMVAPANVAALPHVADHVMRMMLGTSPEGAAAALRGRAERPDYVEMLTRVGVPTLVVVGAADQFTPLEDARLMHDRVDGSEMVVVDGAAHMPNLERPAEFNAALAAFLARRFPVAARPTATVVRRASPADWPAVADLLGQLGRPVAGDPAEERLFERTFRAYLDRHDAVALVAVDGYDVVGFVNVELRHRLNFERPQAWIPELVVAEGSRGAGVGRALLDRAEEVAREGGCWGIALESANWRHDAHRFYAQRGWEQSALAFTKDVPG
jgi:pimeloyl-ACP methyl ester carboxylesterase/GNAT superfamily N-acetyltransferase